VTEATSGDLSTTALARWVSSWRAKRLSQAGCGCDRATRRRRRLAAAVALTGTGLLGASLSTEPDSREFYALTFAVAGTWLVGGLVTEPLALSSLRDEERSFGRLVAMPILTGVAAFSAFFGAALVARRIPILNSALTSVLHYAERGSDPWVLATTLANGVAEEVFFRGSLFTALPGPNPVAASTAVYVLTTCATRNPALVLASGVMGTVFAVQRRASGGIEAPILTHITWSALMLRYIPALFRKPRPAGGRRPADAKASEAIADAGMLAEKCAVGAGEDFWGRAHKVLASVATRGFAAALDG
jgi:membrane protease YdiL (CAAX protease family)